MVKFAMNEHMNVNYLVQVLYDNGRCSYFVGNHPLEFKNNEYSHVNFCVDTRSLTKALEQNKKMEYPSKDYQVKHSHMVNVAAILIGQDANDNKVKIEFKYRIKYHADAMAIERNQEPCTHESGIFDYQGVVK